MLLTVLMLVAATVIFTAVFIALACIQFWTIDSAEVANAFTYGGNTVTQYPLTVFPSEVLKAMTFVVPLAFVNWYPSLLHPRPRGPARLPGLDAVAVPARRGGAGGGDRCSCGAPGCATTDRPGADRWR